MAPAHDTRCCDSVQSPGGPRAAPEQGGPTSGLCLELDSHSPGDTEGMGLWSQPTDLDQGLTYHVTSQALFSL